MSRFLTLLICLVMPLAPLLAPTLQAQDSGLVTTIFERVIVREGPGKYLPASRRSWFRHSSRNTRTQLSRSVAQDSASSRTGRRRHHRLGENGLHQPTG